MWCTVFKTDLDIDKDHRFIIDGSDDEGRNQKQQYKKHSKLYIPK